MEVLSKFRYLYINNPSIPEVLRDLKQENPYNKQTRPGICNMMDHPSNFERIHSIRISSGPGLTRSNMFERFLQDREVGRFVTKAASG